MSTAPLWVPFASASASALAAVVATHRLSGRRDRTSTSAAVRSQAADDLHEQLLNLHRLVRNSRTGMPHERAVAEAVAAWGQVFRRHKSRLPSQMRHLQHSMWDCLGTFFGPPGGSDLIPEVMDEPAAAFDGHWWEATLTYLDYVLAGVAKWRDDPASASKIKCLNFNDWLIATERNPRYTSPGSSR